ncbi:RING/U-box superfamily protein [Prunus dulcis]|uniref:RING-type E3 ubiquitin transferase n=1 Tax=Prunus dulcis TaxID=3755 RepID=A0A4Y1QMX4_PRUDU|nr:RING/U-box superfamily protein [Prunus dulcis]
MNTSPRKPSKRSRSREKLVGRVIWPAIRGQNCPICLGALEPRSAAVLTSCNHAYCVRCIRKWSGLRRKCPLCNDDFDSWFSHVSLSSRSFHREILPPLDSTSSSRSFRLQQEEHSSRHVRNSERRRSRPLPWRRSFGRPGSVTPDVIAERKLQWRVSVYQRRLQAVPSAPRSRLQVALLGDRDPSIIVHVATSLFIASLENEGHVPSGQCDVRDDFLARLRPFLLDRTDMFWHELRCFAKSSFNMETYDAVVEYKRLRQM